MDDQLRLQNIKNSHQGDFKKVLCVCSAGMLRSPTVAWILSNEPFNFNTRAVGSRPDWAVIPIDDVLIQWADTLVFMSDSNAQRVFRKFGFHNKEVIILNLSDAFDFRDPELVRLATDQLLEKFGFILFGRDQYGSIVPKLYVLAPDRVSAEEHKEIMSSRWYENTTKRYIDRILIAGEDLSSQTLEFLDLEECETGIGEILRINDVLKRSSITDGYYHV